VKFGFDRAIAVLARTPATLRALLAGLPDEWALEIDRLESWSAFDIVGHLIHGERTEWIPRARMILEHGTSRPFEPFDRFAQEEATKGKSLAELLDTFEELRGQSLRALRSLDLKPAHLDREGTHPELGLVTMKQLLATWAVHDLAHLAQIAELMASQYGSEVGPWRAYLPILER
jgi:hypothetical protein